MAKELFSEESIKNHKRAATEYEKAQDGMISKAGILNGILADSPDRIREITSGMGMTHDAMKEIIKKVELSNKGFKLSGDRTKEIEGVLKTILDINDKMVKADNAKLVGQKKLDDAMAGYLEKWNDFKALTSDPKIATGLFLVAAAAKATEMGSALKAAQHDMGLSYTQGLKMAGTLGTASIKGALLGIGLKESAAAAGALATEMGDLNDVSSTAIVTVAKLSKKYGVAEAQGAKLFKQIKLMSGGTDDMVKSQLKSVALLAKANNVAPGAVMSDMAQSSEFMAKYGGKSALSMAETAVQAAKLGTNMAAIDSMVSSILDIETSIEKEMQVSVLLGRQISFDKARQLAMAGDTLGATKAILQQVGGIAEFEKMSVIQRKALADAAGVDLATMQSMIGNREKQIEMGLVQETSQEKLLGHIKGGYEFGKKNIGVLSTGMNMLISMSKVKKLSFIKDTIHWAKEKAHLMWKKVFGGESEDGGGSPVEDLQDKGKEMLQDKGSDLLDQGKDKVMEKLGGGAEEAPGGGMMKGMGKIDMKKVVAGAAAMVIVAAAVFIFAKAVQEFMGVSWEAVGMAVVSMLALVGAVALIGAIMMSGVGAIAIIAGAAAMLIVAAAMLVLAIALKIMSEAIPNFMLFIPMLPELALGLFVLAPAIPIMPLIGYGLIALGLGFGIAAVGVGLFGIVGGTEIITGLAAGMAILTPLATGIASLGPAFASMALGVALLAGSLLLLTPMLPTLLLLGGLAMGVGAVMGGMGGDSKNTDDGTSKIVEKLDVLIGLMKEGGIVNMDGKQVGEVIALARGPIGM